MENDCQPRSSGSAAGGKVNVGQTLQQPCTTDAVLYPSTGSMASEGKTYTPTMLMQKYGSTYLLINRTRPSPCSLHQAGEVLLVSHAAADRRLSWPVWLVTQRDSMPVNCGHPS